MAKTIGVTELQRCFRIVFDEVIDTGVLVSAFISRGARRAKCWNWRAAGN